MGPGALVDAALFFAIAWRLGKTKSRAWAVTGLLLYMLEVGFAFATRPGGIGVISIVFVIAYVNAVRGAFAYYRYAKQQLDAPPEDNLGHPSPPLA